MKVSKMMSVFYHSSYATPEIGTEPVYHLWGDDPYLAFRMLCAIRSEAHNRKLTVSSFYDPLAPSLLQGLWVENIGSFASRSNALSYGARLIDCTALADILPEGKRELQKIACEKHERANQIGQIGTCLKEQLALRKTLSLPMVLMEELNRRTAAIAQKTKRGNDHLTVLPILSYDKDRTYRLPFGETVEIIGITGQYDLPALFLDTLLSALAERPCERVVLENAISHEIIGVWLPADGRCYLANPPDGLCLRERALNRYLCPHTQDCRHGHRALRAACDVWREQLIRLLGEYQSLSAREEELYASLYENNRLQNFRKRLLIDLFC